ncbi:MAG: serine/threonine protein kinase [Pirellula sp.]|jgi:hypothetical protein
MSVASPHDQTLDADSPLAIPQRPEFAGASPAEMELLEGDTSSSRQANDLLQTRLRTAAFALGFGFLIFSIWSLIQLWWEFPSNPGTTTLGVELVTTVILIGVALWLSRLSQASANCLRWSELLIFSAPAASLLVMHYRDVVFLASNYSFIPHISMSGWLILIFTYNIFVPRSWRVVMTVCLVMAMAPIIATAVAAIMHEDIQRSLMFDPSCIIEMVLILFATLAACLLGLRMIAYLRGKVDEAKELGRYHLREKLGSGGMGDVYLAEHRLMKRPCAIKVIRPEKAGDPKSIARFEREVRSTSRLNHWNNVSIFDYGRTPDGKFYYVMEYLTGLSLQQMVKKRGPLSPGRAVYLLNQVCNALHEAHSIGLLHRDIKPANLMVTELGGSFDMIKLLDFGLVKSIDPSIQNGEDTDLTMAGSLTGSPLYMSPEQAMGNVSPDQRSDIYSLGGVAHFMLTGKPPFDAGPTLKILLAHLHEPPKAPSLERDSALIPPSSAFDELVLRCLDKSPDNRFQSARELQSALQQLPEYHDWDAHKAECWWTSNCSHYQLQNG